MMGRKLPPLYPLRSFEAVGRCGSFTAAAEELKISQSAVSHQVKKLEAYFEVPLFHRTSSGPMLTAEGKKLFEVASQAFESLSEINHRLPDSQLEGTVSIAAPPLFYVWWLLPRLSEFGQTHPNVRFRIMHGIQLSRSEQSKADISFHWGQSVPDGLTGIRIMTVEYAPVASPMLIARLPPLERPSQLNTTTLLHEVDYIGWEAWMKSAGAQMQPSQKSWIFDDPGMMIESVLHGYGVGLAPFPLINPLVSTGRLLRLFQHSLHPDQAYFYCVSPRASQKRVARAVIKWLLQETGLSDSTTMKTLSERESLAWIGRKS
ncbi:MAG TPA: LysR substrate-binding domain-containing protein [Pseudolabrys sp.]|nr:LysR substrate-binding domain-containing protein [Pseudolabrys sp.]